MATIGTSTLSETWRIKYVQSMLNLALRSQIVAEKVCTVDRSDSYYIANPFLTGAVAAVQALAGTYSVSTPVTTDDTLTITDTVIYSAHLFEFEQTLARADLFGSYVQDFTNAIGVKADQFVLNTLVKNAGTTYTTPVGGFATAANVNQIIADLTGKVAGFAGFEKGLFLVVENTDLTGLIQAGMSNGFNFADATLNNGFAGIYGGVEVYVVRTGVFSTSTIGSTAFTNSGHRLFGIKEVPSTYAAPRGIQYDEKKVTTKTGREIVCWANIGAKVWNPKAALIVDITLA